jgi:hypothetical protein
MRKKVLRTAAKRRRKSTQNDPTLKAIKRRARLAKKR